VHWGAHVGSGDGDLGGVDGVKERPAGDRVAFSKWPHARARLDVPIESKLHMPGPRKEWVERPALIEYPGASTARLILVDAPAGFGKTTLVAQWRSAANEERPFAWISLEPGDDDPGRLWWYILCALQRACPEIAGEDIARELRAPVPDITATVLPLLANELEALSSPVVLVLDDYHVIKERSCHDQIAFLLLHLPPTAQIVLITRADPPLPLARLRAAGEMVEIRARELRFGEQEAAALVRDVSGVALSDADVADLVERTEGWPAGLYLAALSLRGHPSPDAFVRQFTGDNRFVVDFLADEVLGRQPEEIQQFLARTSILSQLCAPLCDAVTGSANAAGIIEVLERENLFLVPLDDNRQWYRYHHLFAQLLRSQLARTERELMPALHARASAWHRRSGSVEEAITHALAADDVSGAVDLITGDWYAYADAGRTAMIRRWMRSLGDERIAANPVAAHCAAWAAALAGDRDSLRRWLPVVESGRHEGPLPDGIQSLQSSAALLRAVFGFDGLRVMRESAVTAAELESNRASPSYALAFSLYLSGEPEATSSPLEEALRSDTSHLLVRMFMLSSMSLVSVELGRLPKAEEFARTARILADRGDLSHVLHSCLAYTAAGAVHAARGQLDEARGALEYALEPGRRLWEICPWHTLEPALRLAQVSLGLGDRARAAELADEARNVLAALPEGAQAQRDRLAEIDRRIGGRPGLVWAVEPLTAREVSVLRLLGGTLSLREIGRELYVSSNTIKTHTQAIYRKLGVSTRRDAVQQGRHQGIV
jgi:LuxR family transcriptional regulator, maltose regulon positive regulatory protein